ncbi:MAG TPA: phenylalanine--tRNA ligase subunit beta, partial [Gemmatimonadales bacterium]
GTPFLEAVPVDDHRLVIDVTPNRPDLLGHKGVARELAASYGVPFRLPRLPGQPIDVPAVARTGTEGLAGGVRVAIEDRVGCGRFLGAVVRGVTIGPSPAWLVQRLESVGLRSISNVVDATNYVMLELGQPLHAYDLATLRGPAIVARRAEAGERLVTLDGVERALAPGMTVIADAERVIGIAGVMGGAATEVRAETRDLFLECAWFAPSSVRAARRALGLNTEASYRFERGVDRWNAGEAFRRCLEVILLVAGGTVEESPIDCWPEVAHPPRIFLRLPRLARVLGAELPLHVIEQCLVSIGCAVVAKPDDERVAVEVPGWRPDLTEEIDLIEEVARRYGYDRIPAELRPFRLGLQEDAVLEVLADRVRDGLVGEGLYEAVTLPLGRHPAEGGVVLANPLSADHAVLRASLLPGLVAEVERNWAAQSRDIRLFEIGTCFAPGPDGDRPGESIRVAAVITGSREPGHWTASGRAPDVDRWDLKGLLEMARDLAHPAGAIQVEADRWVVRAPGGSEVGWAGPLDADAPRWAAPLFGLELTLDPASRPGVTYRPVPTTPGADRDLALVVPDGVAAEAILGVARATAGPALESAGVVDEYRGTGVAEGHRSVAIRLRFRLPDRTLRDQEVDDAVRQVLAALERERGIVLRTS